MAKITNMVHAILTRIANGSDRADRAEAQELLDRLNGATPRFAAAQAKKAKRGARK